MTRAGMISKLARGIYNYLPLGWRSCAGMIKLEAPLVARGDGSCGGRSAELRAHAGGPAGRAVAGVGALGEYGKELLRIKDRHERDFCFGPTHEEVVTDIVRRDVRSYRQLPVNLYQIQTKFRDEIRPRFGLMRGREFMMKDAYSFHATPRPRRRLPAMEAAYRRIFERCGLDYTQVEADTGNIGGSESHEFMVLADTGEDAIVPARSAATRQRREGGDRRRTGASPRRPPGPPSRWRRPGKRTVDEVAAILGVPRADRQDADLRDRAGARRPLIRGDREVNEVKLQNALGVEHLQLAERGARCAAATGAPVGFAGPVGLPAGIALIADESVRGIANFVCGANEADTTSSASTGRDAEPTAWGDLRLARRRPCPRCAGTLEAFRGIEVGHIFKLGTKYSEKMQCTSSTPREPAPDGDGLLRPRHRPHRRRRDRAEPRRRRHRLAAAAGALRGAAGGLNPTTKGCGAAAEELYAEARREGLDVLYDDRDERPGVKFKDADLIGIPLRVVVGGEVAGRG
jgi:prolyl-tRNA synthetase